MSDDLTVALSHSEAHAPALRFAAVRALCKRVLDIILVLCTLPLALPVIMVIALMVRLSGPGPVFLQLTCYGKGGRTFRQLRFRSVHMDAQLRQFRHDSAADRNGRGDPRLTTIGRVLVRSRLNTLPQLFNVLLGDMSFVGPRPLPVSMTDMAAPSTKVLQQVRPGIFAPEYLHPQADRLSMVDRRALALAYAARPTLLTDLRILGVMMKRFIFFGAR